MNGVLIDSNVILDLFLDDPIWADWSEKILSDFSHTSILCINPIIYTEISIGFHQIEALEEAIHRTGLKILDIPKESLFLAGKAFLQYRRNKGIKIHPMPDFYIGAHAAVLNIPLITRDNARFLTYFPNIKLIHPDN
jgi:predicted nucleic acid-binding protein